MLGSHSSCDHTHRPQGAHLPCTCVSGVPLTPLCWEVTALFTRQRKDRRRPFIDWLCITRGAVCVAMWMGGGERQPRSTSASVILTKTKHYLQRIIGKTFICNVGRALWLPSSHSCCTMTLIAGLDNRLERWNGKWNGL